MDRIAPDMLYSLHYVITSISIQCGSKIFLCHCVPCLIWRSILYANLPVSSVFKRRLLVREVWGSIPGLVKLAQCRQPLATAATFLLSCVAQALSRGNGPRHSSHSSA